jgi:diguanylate cyclase (GGDEF)-like protein
LTGLPNRHIVDRYLELSHKQARSGGRAYSLFLIDIDGFRVLNETFGRDWGDALLRSVGERLAGMRGANHVIARHNEDRFVLLAADLAKSGLEKFVEEASRSLLQALTHPFEVKGEPVKLSASIGVAVGPGSDDPRELLSQAERALDSAKAKGVGSYFVHNEALLQKAQRDATYLRQLEHAVARDEFSAIYQPIFNLNKGLVTGVELLLRWHHRDQRILRPDEFLEVAVRSGLIFAITDSLWPKAFRALSRWRKLRPGVTLSINLSDRELLNPKLPERALTAVRSAGLEPSAILFEVRDASRLRLSGTWWTVLGALSEAGFGLALDDYGSESSLFGTLAYAGFRQAKIAIDERNPVCPASPNASKGVLYCAKRVQTKFEPKALKKAGFDLAQGFAVGRPLDETDVDAVLGR